MIRFLLALFVMCSAMLVVALLYLPWWGFLLVLLGIFLALMGTAKLLAGRVMTQLFMIPFKAKGAVLKNATAEVHAVEALGPATNPERGTEAEDAAREAYTIDVTITPRGNPGPFHFWEPGELRLVPANARTSNLTDLPESASVLSVEVFQDGRFGPDEGMKYFGPQRLRLRIGPPPAGERRLAFLYYFEKLGVVTLPVPETDRR